MRKERVSSIIKNTLNKKASILVLCALIILLSLISFNVISKNNIDFAGYINKFAIKDNMNYGKSLFNQNLSKLENLSKIENNRKMQELQTTALGQNSKLKVRQEWNDGHEKEKPEKVTVVILNEMQDEVARIELTKECEKESTEIFDIWEKEVEIELESENIKQYMIYIERDGMEKYNSEVGSIEKLEDNSYEVKISSTILTSIPIEKIWKYESESQRSKMPTSLVFSVNSNDESIELNARTMLTEEYNKIDVEHSEVEARWVGEFPSLPKYNEKGEMINYTINEELDETENAMFYKQQGDALVDSETGKTTFINKFERPSDDKYKKDISVVKIWDDDDEKRRPEGIKVILKAEGNIEEEEREREVILNKENGWQYTFEKLYIYDKDGEPISYDIEEKNIHPDDLFYYEDPVISGDADNGFVITNVCKYKKATIRFVDENDEDILDENQEPLTKEIDGLIGTSFSTKEFLNGVDGKPEGMPEYYEADENKPVQNDGEGTFGETKEVVYHYKLKEYEYTIQYVEKNFEEHILDTVTGLEKYGTKIVASKLSKDIKGYEYAGSSPNTMNISTDKNVMKIYYTKRTDLGYTVYYYEDGTNKSVQVATPKTVTEKTYEDVVTENAIDIDGYNKVSPTEKTIVIGQNEDITNNVIEFYYTKRDDLSYTIKHHYNNDYNEEEDSQRIATYLDKITQETIEDDINDNLKEGYKFDKVSPEFLIIGTSVDENIIDVYYIPDENKRKTLNYTVKYYKDEEEQVSNRITESKDVQYLEDDILDVKKEDIKITNMYKGYTLEKIVLVNSDETQETLDELPSKVKSGSTIELYFAKDLYEYTINFYYGGQKDELRTIKRKAEFGSTVRYEESPKDGYYFDKVDNETIVISEYAAANEINVFYERDKFGYTINYYYDEQKDDKLTVTGEETFGEEVRYEARPKEGYEFERVNPETGVITIESDKDKNVIDVYYTRKRSGIRIRYVDQVSGKEIETSELIEGKVSDKYDVSRNKKQIEDYTLVKSPDEEEIEFVEDKVIVVTYYYAKTTSVIVKYLEIDNTPNDNTDNNVLKEEVEIKGWENKGYKAKKEEISGYTFVKDTENTIGKMTVNPITEVVYYYAQNTYIIVNHVDRNTSDLLATETINGKDGDVYLTKAKDIDGYALVEEPINKEIKMTKDNIGEEVTYYYAHISQGVIEKHIDITTEKVLETVVHDGNEGDEYTTSQKNIKGYDFVENIMPDNPSGTMTQGLIEVRYYYIRKTTLRVQYLDYETGKKLTDDIVKEGHEGDSYKTEEKTFDKYEIITDLYPTNTTGKMGVNVDEHGIETTETVVTYYYLYKFEGVIERHIDVNSNVVLIENKYEGDEGDTYLTEPKEIEGYDIVENKMPDNPSGTMIDGVIEVNYYYIRKAKVVVEYIDINSRETLKEIDNETNSIKNSTETITGHEGDSYKTQEKTFENYEIVKEKYPEHPSGQMEVVRNEAGKVIDDVMHITYYYVYNKSKIIEKYLDAITGQELLETKETIGREGEKFSLIPAEIENYDVIEKLMPENKEVTLTKEEIEIKYYYARKSKVIVKYLERGSNRKLEEDLVVEGHEGDQYLTVDKQINGFTLVGKTNNTEGTMKVTDTEVIYYYEAVVIASVVETGGGSHGSGGVNYKTPNTGDTAFIISLYALITTILANIIQIIVSKFMSVYKLSKEDMIKYNTEICIDESFIKEQVKGKLEELEVLRSVVRELNVKDEKQEVQAKEVRLIDIINNSNVLEKNIEEISNRTIVNQLLDKIREIVEDRSKVPKYIRDKCAHLRFKNKIKLKMQEILQFIEDKSKIPRCVLVEFQDMIYEILMDKGKKVESFAYI